MHTHFPVRSHDQARRLRRLNVFVAVLVLSNIALGVFSFYVLRKIDRRYSELIESSLPILGDIQDLTVMSVQVMRLTNSSQLAGANSSSAQRLIEMRKVLKDEQACRRRILQSDWMARGTAEHSELQAAGEVFSRIASNVTAEIAAGRPAEAIRLRDELLRPAFDRYLESISNADDVVTRESRRANRETSERTGLMSTIVLSLGTWPVVLLGALMMLLAGLVLLVSVMLRDSEVSDLP